MNKLPKKQNDVLYLNLLPWIVFGVWLAWWSIARPANAPEDYSGVGIIFFPLIIGLIYAAAAGVAGLCVAVGRAFHKQLDFKLILTILAVPLSLLIIIPYMLAN